MQSDADIELNHSNFAITGSNHTLGAGRYSLLFVVWTLQYRELGQEKIVRDTVSEGNEVWKDKGGTRKEEKERKK
jgi:hypothetical protein